MQSLWCLHSRYLAGSEEGHIYKCSCSYNEQYLDSYFGHTVKPFYTDSDREKCLPQYDSIVQSNLESDLQQAL